MVETDEPSSNFRKFRLTLAVAAVLLLGSVVVYQVGHDSAVVAAVTGVIATVAQLLALAAALLRWRGPWRD